MNHYSTITMFTKVLFHCKLKSLKFLPKAISRHLLRLRMHLHLDVFVVVLELERVFLRILRRLR